MLRSGRARQVGAFAALLAFAGCSAFGASETGGDGPSDGGVDASDGALLDGGGPGDGAGGGDAPGGGDAGDAGTGGCTLSLDPNNASPVGWSVVSVDGGSVAAGNHYGRPSLLFDALGTGDEKVFSHSLASMPTAIEVDTYVATPAPLGSGTGVLVVLSCVAPTVALRVFLDGVVGLAFTANPQNTTGSYAPMGQLFDAYHTLRFTFSNTIVTFTLDGNPAGFATGATSFTNAKGCTIDVGTDLGAAPNGAARLTVAYARLCVE